MAKFPKSEAEIIALARSIIAGISENSDFPSPPFSASELSNMIDALTDQIVVQDSAYSAAQQATETKRSMTNDTVLVMKAILHYAQDVVHGNDAKLTALGWGGIAAPTPHVLQPPGQPLALEAPLQSDGVLTLQWTVPATGGEAAFYKIERREPADGSAWMIVGTAVETTVTLNNQERGKTWEYRVIAINKAGESLPGNTVAAVL